MADFYTHYRDQVIESQVASAGDLRGCTPSEIAELEGFHGHPLPAMYRGYLATMGQSHGGIFEGCDVKYARLFELKNQATEILHRQEQRAQTKLFALSDSEFVFRIDQNYVFYFFDTATSTPDPAVERHVAGAVVRQTFKASFRSYLSDHLDQVIRVYRRIGRIP